MNNQELTSSKKCTKCKEHKPLSEYNKRSQSLDGLALFCRKCIAIKAKAFYYKSEKTRLNVKMRGLKSKFDAREYLKKYLETHSCVDCGESRLACLDLDHVRDKKAPVSKLVAAGYSIPTVQKELDKCEVRCANCHRVKTAREQSWWKCDEYNSSNKEEESEVATREGLEPSTF